MRAFHTLRMRKNLADFEILTMILSALEWRKHNGTITLVTDSKGAAFIHQYQIDDVWNTIDTSLDELDMLNINENIFWAGAKLIALSKQTAPCVMIDLDFIVWQTLNFEMYKNQLAVIHREDVNNSTYPSQSHFKLSQQFQFNPKWDWQQQACNTAFAYFGNEKLRQYYCENAIKFMQCTQVDEDYLTYMVFAEQRLLSMCATEKNIPIRAFSALNDLFSYEQKIFTHVWGDKGTFRENREKARTYCKDCVARIRKDFPKWAQAYKDKLIQIESRVEVT